MDIRFVIFTKKLQSINPTDDVAYRLCSRLVNRLVRETEIDREQARLVHSPGSDHMIVTTQVIRRLARLSTFRVIYMNQGIG